MGDGTVLSNEAVFRHAFASTGDYAVALSASAAFATPLGYQTHLMVLGPGGYRFKDFLRIGVPLDLTLWVLASIVIPLAWPLR